MNIWIRSHGSNFYRLGLHCCSRNLSQRLEKKSRNYDRFGIKGGTVSFTFCCFSIKNKVIEQMLRIGGLTPVRSTPVSAEMAGGSWLTSLLTSDVVLSLPPRRTISSVLANGAWKRKQSFTYFGGCFLTI